MRPSRRVLIVAPSPPPYGGMALQARLLERMLRSHGLDVGFFTSNQPLPRLLEAVPGVRTAGRFVLICTRLWRAVARTDVVHIFAASWVYFFVVVWPAVLIARAQRKRAVLNYRGGEAARFFASFAWACGPAFRLATVVTAPSTFLSAVITSHFGVPTAIVPNVMDLTVFPWKARERFRPRMLVTRHLRPMYDVSTVLRAARLVQDRYPDASLSIAGTGPEESDLRALAAELKLANVHFLGAVAHKEMSAVHAGHDVLLNASRVDNFPGALVEASASGLAIVSTSSGGIPHIYEHAVSAWLVAPGDHEGLARGVLAVVDSPELGFRLTQSAAKLARACDWNLVCKPLYDAYAFNPEQQQDAVACTASVRG